MTFVDTSAIYALLDRADEHHEKAAATWVGLLDDEEPLITTNYVMIECCALAQRRLGLKAARSIQEDILLIMAVHWIDEIVHGLAVAAWLAAGRAKLSLVDCSNFAVMRQLDMRAAFAFDRHFIEEGFRPPRLG